MRENIVHGQHPRVDRALASTLFLALVGHCASFEKFDRRLCLLRLPFAIPCLVVGDWSCRFDSVPTILTLDWRVAVQSMYVGRLTVGRNSLIRKAVVDFRNEIKFANRCYVDVTFVEVVAPAFDSSVIWCSIVPVFDFMDILSGCNACPTWGAQRT